MLRTAFAHLIGCIGGMQLFAFAIAHGHWAYVKGQWQRFREGKPGLNL